MVPHETEVQWVETGYDYSGRMIVVLDQTDAMGDPPSRPVNTTRRTRSVEDAITRYDINRRSSGSARCSGSVWCACTRIPPVIACGARSVDRSPLRLRSRGG
jgi:hypothetical protein